MKSSGNLRKEDGARKTPPHQRGQLSSLPDKSTRGEGFWNRFKLLLGMPVNASSLAAFRIALGLVMALEAWSLCRPNPAAISSGLTPLEAYYTGPEIKFHFPYEAFSWMPLLPTQWIYVLVAVQALAGVTMALGLCYRLSAAAVFGTWGYLWVVESTRTYWQSHYYLEVLLTFLMIWMPAARRWSVDAWLHRGRETPETVPFWSILLLRGQLVIAYFYAGIAKLSTDWLLDAMPLRWFLAQPHVLGPYEKFLTASQFVAVKGMVESAWFAYFISYSGFVFDVTVGFLLLVRRTRIFALLLMVIFHTTNHFLIFDDIDWFPLVGILTALIFLDPDWPERFWSWVRRPHFVRPDWGWFAGGAILVPVVGAALGWKVKASNIGTKQQSHQLGLWIMPFVIGWLLWQGLMPIRHYFIAGDGRATYEGLSFSWRLKGEARRSLAAQLFVSDPVIISRDESGRAHVNWREWRGEHVVYRHVSPGQIRWQLLPEVVIVLEPVIGERLIYNPLAVNAGDEAQARKRVNRLWQDVYGRPPTALRRTAALPEVLDSLAAGLRAGGNMPEGARLSTLASQLKARDGQAALNVRQEIIRVLAELKSRDANKAIISVLASIAPFSLEGEAAQSAPFLTIEDSNLCDSSPEHFCRIDRQKWRRFAATEDLRQRSTQIGDQALVIYTGSVGPEAKYLMPQACISDSQDNPEQAPEILWNSLKDTTISKFMHISYQAFYLRRYARRIATLWEKEYGRRPAVTATTAVSLNGRPHQALVDPAVDLAGVSTKWFGHNSWIRMLETPRIPPEALKEKPVL